MGSIELFARGIMAGAIGLCAFAPRSARCNDELPAILARAAPSIVRVHCAETWGSGFVYPDPHYVVTAYSIVNQHADPVVVTASGQKLDAQVVAWSERDGLAILEISKPLAAAPLGLDMSTQPVAGLHVTWFGYPQTGDPRDPLAGAARTPAPRFGTIGVVDARSVGVDFNYAHSGEGAPVLSPGGGVLAVLTGSRDDWIDVPDATRAERISTLAGELGRQGKFEAAPKARDSRYYGLVLTPIQDRGLVGAALDIGYRYNWLALSFYEGYTRSGTQALDPSTFRWQSRALFELELTADLYFAPHGAFSVGPGLALHVDHNETQRAVASTPTTSTFATSSSTRAHLRPMLAIEGVAGIGRGAAVFWRIPIFFEKDEYRIDAGILFGR